MRATESGHRELIRGTAAAFTMKVGASGASFVLGVVVARVWGAGGAGDFFLATTILAVASTISRLGLDQVVIRAVAQGVETGQPDRSRTAVAIAIGWSLITSLLVAAGLFFGAGWLSRVAFRSTEFVPHLKWAALAVPALSVVVLLGESLKGARRILLSHLVNGVSVPLVACIVVVVAQRGAPLGPIVSYTVAAYCAAGLGVVLALYLIPGRLRPAVGRLHDLVAPSVPLLVVGLMTLAMASSGTIVLGIYASQEAVGIYSAAARVSLVLSLLLVSANSIAAPMFAADFISGRWQPMEQKARFVAGVVAAAVTPLLAVLLLMPSMVMGLFGPAFRAGSWALRILVLGQAINVSTGSVASLLTMCKKERVARNNILLAGVCNVALQVALVPRFGVNGAAVATAIGVTVQNGANLALVVRVLGIQPIPFLPRRRS